MQISFVIFVSLDLACQWYLALRTILRTTVGHALTMHNDSLHNASILDFYNLYRTPLSWVSFGSLESSAVHEKFTLLPDIKCLCNKSEITKS